MCASGAIASLFDPRVVGLDQRYKLTSFFAGALDHIGLGNVPPHPEGPLFDLGGAYSGIRADRRHSLKRDRRKHLALAQIGSERDLSDLHRR